MVTSPHLGREWAVRAARLLEPATGETLRDAYLHIRDDTIIGCVSERPAKIPVVDLQGSTVLPGLIDCHTHLLLRPEDNDWPPAILYKTQPHRVIGGVAAAHRALWMGFSTARDLGNEGVWHGDTALRDAIDTGTVPGPRLRVASDAISITAGAMTLTAKVNPQLGLPDIGGPADGRDEMIKEIRRQIEIGADWIKIYCTGPWIVRSGFPVDTAPLQQMTTSDVRALVGEARRFGRDVAAHAYGGAGARAAIIGGVRSLEHGPTLTREELSMLAKHGTFWVPTLGAFIERPDDAGHGLVKRHENAFRVALEAGVRIAFGTDVGAYDHGGQMEEFRLMVEYGMTPLEAIHSATTVAAELLRMGGRLGTLAAGAAADLIAVDADPARDIGALRHIRFVTKDGRVFRDDDGATAANPELLWTPSR